MSRILGVDYGSKRVGIAVSDLSKTIAQPLVVLANDDRLVQELRKICNTHEVSLIVMGRSENYQGEDNPIMERIRRFAAALEKKLSVPVVYEPEYLTTAQAARAGENKKNLDAAAASLILQSYLDGKDASYN